ncbi:MAG TPA: glycosyltransferase N-terminal domain-containing protein [Puia sp.]|nr:glycosyltransferase N-terminal domain-containing protein [Puia sp.]
MSIFFYHVFLWLYKIGIRLVAPWNVKARAWLDGRRGIFERIGAEMGGPAVAKPTPGEAVVWMHCSSLGEFEQGRPVIEELRRVAPGVRIVLTFFSPSGYIAKKGYAGADHIFYLPLDSPRNARRFIDLVSPSLVLWVKYDYWYYFLVELKKRNIPTLLVSGVFRSDQPFFHWYGRLHRYMLECFSHLFVQTEVSKLLLKRVHVTENVSVSGDTRFDRVIEISEEARPLPEVEAFCGDLPVIVAGSTWEEDEEEMDHYANTHPEIRFILAPHEISEDRLAVVERLFRNCIRYSSWVANGGGRKAAGGAGVVGGAGKAARPGWPEPNVLLIDNIGMLSKLYRYASIAYVGGGFGDDGVHNVLEAAVYGKPVVYGPVIEKYVEAVELTESGGGIVIDSALEVEKVFDRLIADKQEREETGRASREYVHSRKGATRRIITFIQENRLLTSW